MQEWRLCWLEPIGRGQELGFKGMIYFHLEKMCTNLGHRIKTLSSVSALQWVPCSSSLSSPVVCLAAAAAAVFQSRITHRRQYLHNRPTIRDGRTTTTAIVDIPTLRPRIQWHLRPNMMDGGRVKGVGRTGNTNSTRVCGMHKILLVVL